MFSSLNLPVQHGLPYGAAVLAELTVMSRDPGSRAAASGFGTAFISFSNSVEITLGVPGGTMVKNQPVNAGDAGDPGLISEWGRSPGGRNGSPLQYSCLENPMNRGAWQNTVHGVAQSRTRLSTHTQRLRCCSLLP